MIKNGKIKKVYAIIEKDETAESTNTETNTEVNTEASVPSNGEQISIDYISVLLKNKSKLFFKDIKLKGEKDLFIDGNAIGKEFVASEYFNELDTESVLVYNDNYVNFNGRKYEGNFVITKQKKGFVIVNQLPVETYLKYVIPSEMPQSFESEALKSILAHERVHIIRKHHLFLILLLFHYLLHLLILSLLNIYHFLH